MTDILIALAGFTVFAGSMYVGSCINQASRDLGRKLYEIQEVLRRIK